MKILRLGISDDEHGTLPQESRSWYLAEKRFAEATGETWETVLRPSWPSSSLVRDVEADLEIERPDLVMLCCAAFWVSYPSAPLRIHRSTFPGSERIARAAFWAASKPAIAHRSLFHLGRRAITAGATVEFFFTPELALRRVEETVRTILRHEDVALAVRGPLPLTIAASPRVRGECERRRAVFEEGVAGLCETLHVAYAGFGPEDRHPADELAGDRIHVNAKGHSRRAEHEFDVMLRAWRAHTSSGDHEHPAEG